MFHLVFANGGVTLISQIYSTIQNRMIDRVGPEVTHGVYRRKCGYSRGRDSAHFLLSQMNQKHFQTRTWTLILKHIAVFRGIPI